MDINQQPQPIGNSVFSAKRVKAVVCVLTLVAAVAYLVIQAFNATVYSYTIDELWDKGPSDDGEVIRVTGTLIPDSFIREPDSTKAWFTLTNGTETVSAIHQGLVPDLFFNEHSAIILEGSFSANGVFESYNVIVKCPSKYIATPNT